MELVDCVVVGAGVVGLAVARALALGGREVVILERGGAIGTGISSRNSEVIHAGIYDEPGSLKAQLCVRGRQLLYEYAAQRGVPARHTGKLVVATTVDELPRLAALMERGRRNGVSDLVLLNPEQARELEPLISCTGAVLSPSSGIVDSHALMISLLGDAESAGALLAFDSPFDAAFPKAGRWVVRSGGSSEFEVEANWLINCAGLHAPAVAGAITGFPSRSIPAQRLAKGCYFVLAGRSPFSRLVYPLPGGGGLGVHLTIDLGGQAKFGPDVEWLAAGTQPQDLDYSVDARREEAFYAAIRRYWKTLPDGALHPAYAGIRPKLSGPGEAGEDFRIDGPEVHGCAGLVHLFGIESPGLTSSMAIAERVAEIVCARNRGCDQAITNHPPHRQPTTRHRRRSI